MLSSHLLPSPQTFGLKNRQFQGGCNTKQSQIRINTYSFYIAYHVLTFEGTTDKTF